MLIHCLLIAHRLRIGCIGTGLNGSVFKAKSNYTEGVFAVKPMDLKGIPKDERESLQATGARQPAINTDLHMHKYIYIYIYICNNISLSLSLCIYIYIYSFFMYTVYICVYMYTFIPVFLYLPVYYIIYIYIHVYIYIC